MNISDRSIAIAGVIFAILFGIAGLFAAYYFYLKALQERVPTFMMDSGLTIIVMSREDSDISISYRGQPIKHATSLLPEFIFGIRVACQFSKLIFLNPFIV
jgi:hypothetical protein